MEGRIHKSILITPLERPEGITIKRYLGLIRSVVVDTIPPHLEILTLLSSARKRRSPISSFISSLVHDVLVDLEAKARQMDGNAVLGLRIEVTYMGWGKIMAMAYGTVAEVEG